MVYMLLADGFEDVEALAPLDFLRRADVEIQTVAIAGESATSSHGVTVKCDISADQMNLDAMQMLILPGGAPGYKNLDESPVFEKALTAAVEKGCGIAAICASPTLLGKRGLLKDRVATCYPGMEGEMGGAVLSGQPVCVDGPFVTSRSAGTAIDFALALVAVLCSNKKAMEIREQIHYRQ